jgi:Fe2+ or Zn2+ uptake regulation protein
MLDLSTETMTSEWLHSLHANGYRLTEPRQAVVAVIASSQRVLNPLEVFSLARQRYPSLGLVTVYRTIEKLEELNLVQRVHQPSGCQGFIAAFRGHQHMLICQNCGQVAFFSGDMEQLEIWTAELEVESGFSIREHWLQLFGLCTACRLSEAGVSAR